MPRPTLARSILVVYLVALVAIAVASAFIHVLAYAAAAGALIAIPLALWALAQGRQEAQHIKDGQRELQVELQEARAMAAGAAGGLFIIDLEGRFFKTDETFRHLLGYSESEFAARSLKNVTLHADISADAIEFKELTLGTREKYRTEKRFVRQDERIIWTEMSLTLLRDETGKPEAAAGMLRDVTSEKQAGGALQDMEGVFRLTFDQAALGIGHTDKSGRFLFVNARLCDMLGYRRDELFGRELRSIAHTETHRDGDPAGTRGTEQAFDDLLSGKIVEFTGEQRYTRKDGSAIWGSLTMSLVRQPDGEPKYCIVMIEDVTEQKAMREALRENEERYRAITETASDAIVTTDGANRILYVNRATTTIFGYQESELVGQPLNLLFPESWRDAPEASPGHFLAKAGRGDRAASQIPGRRKDGASLFLEMSFTAWSRGHQAMFTGVIRDVTERKRADEERSELAAREQEARATSAAATVIRDVIGASPLAIITLDPEGNVQSWNAAAAKTFGWREGEVVGGPVPFVPEGEESESHEFRERAMRGVSVTNLEIRRRALDGHTMDMYMSTAPVRDKDGEISGIIYVYADITDQKQAEAEVKIQRDFALQVMNTMGQGLAVTDLEGRFEFANPAYARMLDSTPDGLIGRSAHDFTNAGERDILDEAVRCCREGRATTYETHVRTEDGRELFLLTTNVPRKRDGVVAGAIAVATDLTERKRSEEALTMARDQALEGSRLKSEFLATMSHEIRTPMNGILGMIELLFDTRLDTEQQEYISVVSTSAQELLRIINDILDFSKIEADKVVLDHIDLEPCEIIEGAAELLAGRAREKNLSLMTVVDPAIPSRVRGDAGRLRQVLLNLIGNAVKFTDAGDVVVRAALDRESETGVSVRFSVTDTGIGLSEIARKRLFQAFVQADGSTTRKYGGTGLGLAICKKLTEMMGGDIGVESVEGHGSTFWFTATFGPAQSAGEAAHRPDLSGTRALVIDGHPLARDVMRDILAGSGVEVDVATTGGEAIELIAGTSATHRYHIIVADFNLPDMDAVAVLHRTRLNRIPIIAVATGDRRGQGETAISEGMAAYLVKPAKGSQIVEAVRAGVHGLITGPPSEGATAVAIEATEPERVSGPVVPMRTGRLILVVEDNPNNQITAMRQLEKLGYAVHIVSNGLQAVTTLAYGSSRYDLVFMDCQMPEMDGFAATKEIRKSEVSTGRHVPVIAMTANAMSGDRENCLAAGMDDYISKPISRVILREALDRWMPDEEVDMPRFGGAALAGQ